MALLKPIEIANTGLLAAYWRLVHVQIDHDAGIVEYRLHGYEDGAARAAGKAPLPVIVFRLTAEAIGRADLNDVTTAMLYAAARSQPATDGSLRFADALDG